MLVFAFEVELIEKGHNEVLMTILGLLLYREIVSAKSSGLRSHQLGAALLVCSE